MFSSRTVWAYLYPVNDKFPHYALKNSTCIVGKGSGCDVTITGDHVSLQQLTSIETQHFKIKKKEDGIFLKDLSQCGTYVNARKVEAKYPLKHNDKITMVTSFGKGFVFLEHDITEKEVFCADIKDKYLVSTPLGAGGFGEVSLVFNKKTGKKFAMKLIRKKPNQEKYADTEAKILRSLDHPCVIQMEDIVDTPKELYIVLELMQGGDLHRRVRTKTRLNEAEAKAIFYQLTLAVVYLQHNKIVHRDLKPENILLQCHSRDTLIKVTDFGISKIEHYNTVLKTALGTLAYVAPEIIASASGLANYTNKVDLWSMGVILYYCLDGNPPFDGHTAIVQGRYNFNRVSWKSTSEVAKDLIRNLLIVDANKRITLRGIQDHRWLKDEVMRIKVKGLMYPDTALNQSATAAAKQVVKTYQPIEYKPLLYSPGVIGPEGKAKQEEGSQQGRHPALPRGVLQYGSYRANNVHPAEFPTVRRRSIGDTLVKEVNLQRAKSPANPKQLPKPVLDNAMQPLLVSKSPQKPTPGHANLKPKVKPALTPVPEYNVKPLPEGARSWRQTQPLPGSLQDRRKRFEK